jgi:hypothetical protein
VFVEYDLSVLFNLLGVHGNRFWSFGQHLPGPEQIALHAYKRSDPDKGNLIFAASKLF